ncbi:hypothetical protein [Micromonospora sp. NPDC050695]|uniref:hypothetical protein n=1 Tax=Micromonospora sp. NPDC050695 TaxID=3154938 RepID=UPI0034066566
MSWRRRHYRAGERPERSFARRVGFETAKEGGGTLLQQAGAALGALVGLISSRWGLPPSASVITGAIVGSTIGSIGKGVIAASLDHLRERREQQESRVAPGSTARRSWRHTGSTGRSARAAVPVSSGNAAASLVGQVVGGLDRVVAQLSLASRRLDELHRKMWATHNALSAVLAGGRPAVVGATNGQLTEARGHIQDCTVALRHCRDGVEAYRIGI